METESRESFVFYRSFHEATKDLTPEIRLEVLTAIIEYALYGIQPDALKPFARGIFILVKPIIDANTARFENGKKGGRKSPHPQKPATPPYALTWKQEVDIMKTDAALRRDICQEYNITDQEYNRRLQRFLDHCKDDKKRKNKTGHNSPEDCRSHLRYWMTKAYAQNQPPQQTPETPNPIQPTSADTFGGVDYAEK